MALKWHYGNLLYYNYVSKFFNIPCIIQNKGVVSEKIFMETEINTIYYN